MLQRLHAALKDLAGAERVYLVVLLESVAHFHAWLVPRTVEAPERGVALLMQDTECDQADAQVLAKELRALLIP